jgi:predicted HTH transcriptional regulator
MASEVHTQPTLFDELSFVEHIESLLNDSESSDLEFKSAQGGFPESFWETYSAFANTQGGAIVLGVKEKKGLVNVEGLTREQIDRYKKDFWNKANNREFISSSLLKNSDIEEGEYDSKLLLVFNVPRAERHQIPVYRTTNPFGNTFKRNHEGDYKCTDPEVKRMIADSDDTHPQDARILENFTMADIDADSLRQYRQLFSTNNSFHPWLGLDDRQLLEKLGGYRSDRRTKQQGLTLAGLLMFGKTASIQDPECAPQYFPDYREYLSADPNDRWTDRIYPDGTWEANLFQFYRRVFPKLAAFLPKPFKLENGIRKDETPTHIALREAFINSLVHTDYTVPAGIVIESHKNRFKFSNPGTLLISTNQYYKGGDSVCRNTSLQKMFMMIGSAEKAGSGVDKIMSGWKGANLAHPYIDETLRPDKVVLELPLLSLLSTETISELKRIYGDGIESIDRNKLLALATCCTEGEITNDRLRLLLDLHRADITRLLQELSKSRHLISSGVGRGTRYTINQEFLAGASILTDKDESKDKSKAVSKDKSMTGDEHIRLSRYALQKQILEVCIDYQSVEAIASSVNKTAHYLIGRIIPSMIKAGLLEREFPNSPRHPQQRYRAKASEQ